MKSTRSPALSIGRGLCAAAIVALIGGCTSLPYQRLPKTEQKRYFELAAVCLPPELKDYGALPDSAARERYWRQFWKKKDPTPTTERNERYEEHLARVAFADDNFGSSNFYWDDRGKIYIKYGDPDDREWNPMGSAPSDYVPSFDPTSDTSEYAMVSPSRGWERWIYSRPGREFTFVQQLSGYRLAKSLYSAQSFKSSITTAKVFELNEVDRSLLRQLPNDTYQHDYGQPLEFPFGLSRFGDSLGADVWLYYSLPLAKLSYNDSTGRARLSRSVVILDHGMNEAARDDQILSPTDPGKTFADAQAIDVCRFRLPPGEFTAAISVEDTRAQKTGIYEYQFRVIDYLAGAEESSDLLLARTIALDTAESKFHKGEYRIVPQPAYAFKPGSDLLLYFEIYNLKPDSAKQYRAELRYYLISKQDKVTRGTAPQIVGSRKPNVSKAASLSLKGLAEGSYIAMVKARDLATGKERTLANTFKIVK